MSHPTTEPESERARAAVAVACLRWLNCTGATGAVEPKVTVRPIPDLVPIRHLPTPPEPAHPLWDRWLDTTD